jgi:large subunit ribosomal protein L4
MPSVDIRTTAGETVGSIELDIAVFAEDINEHLIWETVKWQLAKRRAGTHQAKTRAEVNGTTAKPWRQKGTGRARHGDRKSPIWVGGGKAFGPRPRDYGYNMPKKARKKALRGVLTMRAAEDKLIVVDEFAVGGQDRRLTKAVATALAALGVAQPASKVLIVDSSDNSDLARGARNLKSSSWIAPEGLNVYDVMRHQTLVMTRASLEAVQEALRP